jgi:hypothetical protein
LEIITTILVIIGILTVVLFLIYYIGSLLKLGILCPLVYWIKVKLGIINEDKNFNDNLDKKLDHLQTGKTTNRFLESISSILKAIG